MVKIALDAGHGLYTPGKRSPADEREWTFNNKVLLACQERLKDYEDVQVVRLDDPTGKTDVPLSTRTRTANSSRADVLVSIHHNANTAKWGNWGGVETFVYPRASTASRQLATNINPRIVQAMGLRDRGVKTANLAMLRDSNMPAILTEGGFMDSTTDIIALRDNDKMKAQGEAIADGLASHFGLKLKKGKDVAAVPNKQTNIPSPSHKTGWEWAEKKGYMNGERPKEGLTREQFASVMMKVVSDLEK
ncbi:N-acetylmuramoyl-L-alanine amidase [Sporosarcina sp. P18a]|uniref:N-acetylmuramoyl-L-alanine amidase family protein n=1 Tax=Sporosarcina sp. P18a TaxID=2048259 RepID=UPI000C17336D|nr:N-acetylmuramoyl-L-alanine amidase [Sporosarcina sp. P18a]PIC81009.1 N-acetylmuramoyl-L-alanine amidase [Sporosarcina sp. P18a]